MNTKIVSFVLVVQAEWRLYASVSIGFISSDDGLSPVQHQAIIGSMPAYC